MPALQPRPTPPPSLARRTDSVGPVQASLIAATASQLVNINEGQAIQACIMQGDCEGSLATMARAVGASSASGGSASSSALGVSSSPSSLGATRTAAIAAGAVAAFLLFIVVPGVLLYRRLRYQKGFQKCGTGGVAEDGGATETDSATLLGARRSCTGQEKYSEEDSKEGSDHDEESGAFVGAYVPLHK